MGSVTAQIAFLNNEWKGRAELARIYSRETRHANTTKHEIEILDARPLQEADRLDLDTNGFKLVQHACSFDRFEDRKAIETEYFSEMRELILELTGAEDAIPFPFYQVRSRNPAHFFDAYSLYMHCDFSLNSWHDMAQRIIRDHGGGRGFDPSDFDFALFNLWRPIGQEVQQSPLTLIAADTVKDEDILEYRLAPEGTASLAALPVYDPEQQLYYFPRIRPDEVLVFKQQDSRHDRAKVCPHTAFIDPGSPTDAPERHSIDIRMLCIFPKVE